MVVSILLFLLFGAVAGWLAGLIMKTKSGLLWNIILGIVGSFVGGFIASRILGVDGGNLIISLLIAVAGACLLIFIGKLLKIVK